MPAIDIGANHLGKRPEIRLHEHEVEDETEHHQPRRAELDLAA
ncbi:MAG: hypothetical protein PGN25_11720 [Methylorubrum populi]